MKIVRYNEDTVSSIQAKLEERKPSGYAKYETTVLDILESVKEKGDKAVFEYTKKFDHFDISEQTLKVTQKEIDEAYQLIDKNLVGVIKKAINNIRTYHEKQKKYSWFDTDSQGNILGQKLTPLDSVGVYVPGGKAVYPSTAIMNVIPAKVAGVHKIVMVTPPGKNGCVPPLTLVAAHECGIEEIYKVGGAQAIAALAYGTKSIPKVDKIVGPGNIYVTLAKKAVFGHVSIDSIAGPSEVLVIADASANPEFVAADLIAQAEHDELASAICIITDEMLALDVNEEVIKQTNRLERKEMIKQSLDHYGMIIIVKDWMEAAALSNQIAPEHLEICTNNAFEVLPHIKHAGAIFLGQYSPEPLGDYMAGPNHVLPTNGTAKFFSPLGVDDFMKKSSIIAYTKPTLKALHKDIIAFAEAESLTGHANSLKVRFKND